MKRSLAAALLVTAFALPARADDQPSDVAEDAWRTTWARVARPWLYTPDASAPPPLHVIASMGAGYASVDRGAARPFAADVAHAGAVFDAAAEVGLLRFLAVEGQVLFAVPPDDQALAVGGMTGLVVRPLSAKWPVGVSLGGGYLRELGGSNGAWGRVAFSGGVGLLRFGGSLLGEHIAAPDRDGVDVMVTTATSVRVLPWLDLGAEYVVQDLEGAWERDEADGGVRHFVGPTLALALARHVHVTAGPAVGLSQQSPTLLGRLQASAYF